MTINKSMIFAIAGIVGTGISAFVFAKAGAKASKQIEEETARLESEEESRFTEEYARLDGEDEDSDSGEDGSTDIPEREEVKLSFWDKAKLTWKTWIVPGAILAATLVVTIASHAMNWKSITALTGTAAYLAMNRDKIEQEIEKRYGKDVMTDIRKTVQKQLGAEVLKYPAEETGNGDLLCYDAYNGRMFRSSKKHVDWSIEEAKRLYKEHYIFCWNDMFDLWKISNTQSGARFGWSDLDRYCGDTPRVFQPMEFTTEYVEDGNLWFEQEYDGIKASALNIKAGEPVYVINVDLDNGPAPEKIEFPSYIRYASMMHG